MDKKDQLFQKNIRIEEVILSLEEDQDAVLMQKIGEILGISIDEINNYKIAKQAIDARKINKIQFVYSLDVTLKNPEKFISSLKNPSSFLGRKIKLHKIRIEEPYVYEIQKTVETKIRKRPLVVGSGPAGLFSALVLALSGCNPIIIERGKDVDSRVKDVNNFFESGALNTSSNIQFGEGGAGTFSDGKLYTLINSPKTKFIFEEFVKAGAPEEIIWNSKPHIGTDRLRLVVKNLRKKILMLGGEFHFNSCLTDIEIDNGRITAAILSNGEKILTDDLVLAIGHSARDTYEMLYEKKIDIEAKPFSVGLRIEHEAEVINRALYGKFSKHKKLSSATYKLVAHLPKDRSVYTFCMCPGGYVVAAASEENRLVTNGMSEYSQSGNFSNSALLCGVKPSDFSSNHPLAGMEFQRFWEEKAFSVGGGKYQAPVQLVNDFLLNKPSSNDVVSTYKPGVLPTSLTDCLPDYIIRSLKQALPIFNKKLKGFTYSRALLIGIETRSSAPLRLLRDDTCQSNIKGLYPAGEGAGYAGGIVSSALDGLKVAESIIQKYSK